jgi:hypothetical protein
MSPLTLIIAGVLLLAMIGVSSYGAAILPPGARMPIHLGPTGYNQWVPKIVGLLLWPVAGLVVSAILFVHFHGQHDHGGRGATIGLTIALAAMLVLQFAAVKVALNRTGRS